MEAFSDFIPAPTFNRIHESTPGESTPGQSKPGETKPGPKRGRMNNCKFFKTFKERGEWVELRFMAQALEHGFAVSRPWGDCRAYDIGIEQGQNFLRVQVKSTTCRIGTGYFCQFKPNSNKKEDYNLRQIDIFAAYVIPVDVWYLIPAAVLLGPQRKSGLMLFPMVSLKRTATATKATKKPGPCSPKPNAP